MIRKAFVSYSLFMGGVDLRGHESRRESHYFRNNALVVLDLFFKVGNAAERSDDHVSQGVTVLHPDLIIVVARMWGSNF